MGRPKAGGYAARIGELRRLGHELRTPLTLIQGYISLLEDDQLASEKRRDACALVREKCAEMNRVISAFLDDASDHEQLAVQATAPGLQTTR
jgi:signal transduction histidine kinase